MPTNFIQELLANPGRSRHREYLLTTQFIRDMLLAAAKVGYDLLVYLPTVDSDGFDVIVDDRRRLLPLQLKSVVGGGKAAGWSVHKTLLWPDPAEANLYGLNVNWSQHGRGGGVVLVRAVIKDGELVPQYAYTDIDVLAAIWYGIWPLPVPQRRRLDRLKAELSDESNLKIMLPRSAFLSVPTVDHLLALAGLRAELEIDWRSNLRSALQSRKPSLPFGDLDPQWSAIACNNIRKILRKPELQPEPRSKRARGRITLRRANENLYRLERLIQSIREG